MLQQKSNPSRQTRKQKRVQEARMRYKPQGPSSYPFFPARSFLLKVSQPPQTPPPDRGKNVHTHEVHKIFHTQTIIKVFPEVDSLTSVSSQNEIRGTFC